MIYHYLLPKTKTFIKKDICTSLFIAAMNATVKIWNQHRRPTVDEWIMILYRHTMEYYSAPMGDEFM